MKTVNCLPQDSSKGTVNLLYLQCYAYNIENDLPVVLI